MRRPLKSVFPPVPLGQAEVVADPRRTWQRLLDDVASARREVLLENYILLEGAAADALVDTLVGVAARGVRVRVHVDGAGSFLLGSRRGVFWILLTGNTPVKGNRAWANYIQNE